MVNSHLLYAELLRATSAILQHKIDGYACTMRTVSAQQGNYSPEQTCDPQKLGAVKMNKEENDHMND